MARTKLLLVVPVLGLLFLGGQTLQSASGRGGGDRRIASDSLFSLERELGYHLYAPTWLPEKPKLGNAMVGARRVLHDYGTVDGRVMVIVSQERRSGDRDRYHQKLFCSRPEAQADIGGRTGYFVTGQGGERRLFWNEEETAVILSSSSLSDADLARIARSMK